MRSDRGIGENHDQDGGIAWEGLGGIGRGVENESKGKGDLETGGEDSSETGSKMADGKKNN